MSEETRSIFLCPYCGFPAAATAEGDAECPECQKQFSVPVPQEAAVEEALRKANPRPIGPPKSQKEVIQRNVVLNSRSRLAPVKQIEAVTEPLSPRQDIEEMRKNSGERRKRLKKRSRPPARRYFFWFAAWVGTVALVLFIITKLQSQFEGETDSLTSVEDRLVGEEREFFKREYPRITKRFQAMIQSRTMSQMSEYSLPVRQLERKMGRHYKESSFRANRSRFDTSPTFWNVAFEEKPGFVEVVWDRGNNEFYEGVFVKVDEDWVLDWEHFVRYSSESWTLFSQQISSQKSGVFRLYIEKVSEGEGEDFNPWIKVRLLPSYSDPSRREREGSETILLDGDEPVVGKMIQLFLDRGGQSKGFSELWKRDPSDLRRAAVELAWEDDEATGEEKMVIKDILADHWRTLDADLPGDSPQPTQDETSTDE